MRESIITHVFVYGTLKRGQCRASMWPVQPVSVRPAWVHGRLFGRSDYPAMLPGEDQVLGEIWDFDTAERPGVVRALDAIEGTNQPGLPDLFIRVRVKAYALDGEFIAHADAYHYARDPESDGFERIRPDTDGSPVRWP